MRKALIATALMAAAASSTTGCAAILLGAGVAAGAGTVAYVKGDLESDENVDIEVARGAAASALEAEGYTVVRDTRAKGTSYTIKGERPGDDSVVVTLESRRDTVTHVKIRVGTFGDEARSNRLLEKMRERFATAS